MEFYKNTNAYHYAGAVLAALALSTAVASGVKAVDGRQLHSAAAVQRRQALDNREHGQDALAEQNQGYAEQANLYANQTDADVLPLLGIAAGFAVGSLGSFVLGGRTGRPSRAERRERPILSLRDVELGPEPGSNGHQELSQPAEQPRH